MNNLRKESKKYLRLIHHYLPDILVILGTYYLSYYFFKPVDGIFNIDIDYDYYREKALGLTTIVFGVIMLIRRFYKNR